MHGPTRVTAGLADFGQGDVNQWWMTLLTPGVVIAVLIVIVVLACGAGITAFVLYRRIRRDPRLRRSLRTMRAQYGVPGARRDVLQLQLRLEDGVSAAQRAVEAAERSDSPTGELGSAVRRIERLAASLGAQLHLLADEPDETSLAQLLPPIRARVDALVATTTLIRKGALDAMSGLSSIELAEVVADVDKEVRALQAGVRGLHDLLLELPARRGLEAPKR